MKHIHFDTIDSTNTWSKRHTGEWAPEGVTLVTASKQTSGRGRFKRTWISPPDVNIYATFCFWFDPKRNDVGHIPQLLALAGASTLMQQGFLPKIKWPNDLLLNGKKVAGILCETILEQEKRGVICGIGLNVNMEQKEISQIDRPATSLFIEAQRLWDKETLLQSVTKSFLNSLETFVPSGFDSFFSQFEALSFLKRGDAVHFHDFRTEIKGTFETMHSNGAVELRLADGTLKIYHAGEFL